MEIINICLTDLPPDKFMEDKRGNKFINLAVEKRKEVDHRGNDLEVYVLQSKEELQKRVPKTVCGKGKTIIKRENRPDNGNYYNGNSSHGNF